jgi:hypothetical protein
MPSIGWHAEADVEVARAIAMGRAVQTGTSEAMPIAIYAASMCGDARLLGAFQRLADALAGEHAGVHRRTTGGPLVVAGEGTLYLALGLVRADALMECPRDRVLNRNVRPILAALRALGGNAHYFGRDFVSIERRPAGFLGWAREPDGRVLVELVLGVDRSFAPRDDELGVRPETRFLGKEPIALADAMEAPRAGDLAAAVARACATLRPYSIEERAPVPKPRLVTEPPALRWSRPREVPIGIVRAGIALGARGTIADAAIAGDFFQDADAPPRLRDALAGRAADPQRVRDAVHETYGPGGAVIEGLKTLEPIVACFVELVLQ